MCKESMNKSTLGLPLLLREAAIAQSPLYLMDNQNSIFDPNTTIQQDLSTNPYVRHYMQEEQWLGKAQEERIELPFNHLINLIISQLSLINRNIANNSKLTTSLIQNGKDIFQKKKQYFKQFCSEYRIIGDALELLPPQVSEIFKYSVVAMANLILKLSINMAKISIVIFSRYLMPRYLNPFTTAFLFEKYLELQLVRGKNFANAEEHRHYLKQFPKVSVIRFSKRRNPYDLEFVTYSQAKLNQQKPQFAQKISKDRAKFEVCNLQLIEFFEQEAEDSKLFNNRIPSKNNRHEAFNLRQTFGLSAPFGFELFHLILEMVVEKMIDFKPELILFIEDLEEEPLIHAKVRGLIVNLLSQKVQNKIYVLREFGVSEGMKKQWLIQKGEQQVPEFLPEFSKKMSSIINSTNQSSFIEQSDRFATERNMSIKEYTNQNMAITFDWFKKLQNYCKNLYLKSKGLQYNMGNDLQDLKFKERLKNYHNNAIQDLTYLSLALIQKSNFQETVKAYHNYVFPVQFLDKTMKWLSEQIEQLEQKSQIKEYRYKIQKVRDIKKLNQYLQSSQQTVPTKFFNFLTGKVELFQIFNSNTKQARSIRIDKQDSFYVAYVQDYVILFLFGQSGYGIYRKKIDQTFFTVVREQQYNKQTIGLSRKYSACVANHKFFYKAFGEARNRNPSQKKRQQSQIFRIEIERPQQLQNEPWKRPYTTCFVNTGNGRTQIPLQEKIHGFGFSYDNTDQKSKKVNTIIFGGGYNLNAQNQQKINRYFYVLRDNSNQVSKIGKTNDRLLNQGQNMRNKSLIYPFVYGIPFVSSPTQFAILNTNGYLQNINNFKKLFLTKVKSGPLVTGYSSIGIIAQNKLDFQNQSPEIAVANKNTILASLINSYHRVNRMGFRVALQNAEGKIFIMEYSKATQADKFDIVRVEPVESSEMSHEDQTLRLFFPSNVMIPAGSSAIQQK